MTQRDELATLIYDLHSCHDEDALEIAENASDIADAIIARVPGHGTVQVRIQGEPRRHRQRGRDPLRDTGYPLDRKVSQMNEWDNTDYHWTPTPGTNEQVYVDFVRARHSVWEKRSLGLPAPWTDDPIVATRKFTCVFRILDRGSQFLYEIMRDEDYHTALFRAFLYRYTNRPEPWVAFEEEWGCLPTHGDAVDGTLLATWMAFRHQKNMSFFGNAYTMFSGLENKGTDRLTWAVNLARDYITPEFSDNFQSLDAQWKRAKLLQGIPRCAGFMSQQILTDMAYYGGDNENEFVIPGPGAIVGAKAITGQGDVYAAKESPLDLIRTLTAYWTRVGDVNLYGRTPSLMDVQNSLCEFGKYIRWSPGRAQYKPVGEQQDPILPDHYRSLI